VGLEPLATTFELAVLSREQGAADRSLMRPAELVDHIEATHRRRLWAELPRISALIAKVASVHGHRHPELSAIEALFDDIRFDVEPHLLKEDRVVFPMIRDLASDPPGPMGRRGRVDGAISAMLRDHDAVADGLAELRRLTNQYLRPSDGCSTYVECFAAPGDLEAETHLHVHKENNLLFPMVLALERATPTDLESRAARSAS
jgi:regulator of cell morphogenesis and NO signaling